MWNLFVAVYFDVHVVYAPLGAPLNASLVEKALDQLQFDWMFLPPSIIEDVAREQKILPKLEKLRYVMFAGGEAIRTCSFFRTSTNLLQGLSLSISAMSSANTRRWSISSAPRRTGFRRSTSCR